LRRLFLPDVGKWGIDGGKGAAVAFWTQYHIASVVQPKFEYIAPPTPFKGSTTPAGDILLEGEAKFLRGLNDAGIPVGCPLDAPRWD
jgi:hypothetical protein